MTEPNFPPREAFRNASIAEATLFIWINALIDKADALEKRVAALEAHKIKLEPTSPITVNPITAKLSDRLKILLLRSSNKILVEACKGVISTYVFLDSLTAGIEPQHGNILAALDTMRLAIDAAEKTKRKTSD